MKSRLLLPLALMMIVGLVLPQPCPARVPVILDTDLGTDIDDTWALAQALRSPEIDLKMVITATGDTDYRTALVAKFLQVSGRTEVPIGTGHNSGHMREQEKNQLPWLEGYDASQYPGTIHQDGIQAMIDLIMNSPETITVVAVGAVPNIARALEREPRIAAKCRFVGMHGSFRVGYGGSREISAEANVRSDPAALRTVLGAPWQDILLTPLDTCGLIDIEGEDYHAIWCATEDAMLRALIENYCIFAPRVGWMHCDYFALRSTVLFDCVAVYLAYAEDLVGIETLTFNVTDDGFTRLDPRGQFKARVATTWKDQAAFEQDLADRLLQRRRHPRP